MIVFFLLLFLKMISIFFFSAWVFEASAYDSIRPFPSLVGCYCVWVFLMVFLLGYVCKCYASSSCRVIVGIGRIASSVLCFVLWMVGHVKCGKRGALVCHMSFGASAHKPIQFFN